MPDPRSALPGTKGMIGLDTNVLVRALLLAEEGADFPDALIHTSFEQSQCGEAVTFDRRAASRFGWRLLAHEE